MVHWSYADDVAGLCEGRFCLYVRHTHWLSLVSLLIYCEERTLWNSRMVRIIEWCCEEDKKQSDVVRISVGPKWLWRSGSGTGHDKITFPTSHNLPSSPYCYTCHAEVVRIACRTSLSVLAYQVEWIDIISLCWHLDTLPIFMEQNLAIKFSRTHIGCRSSP